MTECPTDRFDAQQLILSLDDLRGNGAARVPIRLAAFLIYSGYVDLGASLLRGLYPDCAEHRRKLICRLVREAHNTPIRGDTPDHGGTSDTLHITAHRLHTDRTGRELRRIADFLDKTDLQPLAELFRAQPPAPYPRTIAPPGVVRAWQGPLQERP